jgi:hypothetical protein
VITVSTVLLLLPMLYLCTIATTLHIIAVTSVSAVASAVPAAAALWYQKSAVSLQILACVLLLLQALRPCSCKTAEQRHLVQPLQLSAVIVGESLEVVNACMHKDVCQLLSSHRNSKQLTVT